MRMVGHDYVDDYVDTTFQRRYENVFFHNVIVFIVPAQQIALQTLQADMEWKKPGR